MKAQIKPRINLEDRTSLEKVIPLETPFIVFVDPASACNFQCTFCPTGHRPMIKDTGRFQGAMKLDLFKKIIDDLDGFNKPIRVLRLYKDGEPFLNKNFHHMIRYAKQSKQVEYIDTTTNASLLTKKKIEEVVDAGLDKVNISIDGMTEETYKTFTKFDVNFKKLVENIKYFYSVRKDCEMVVKVPGDIITEDQKKLFYDTFGDYCDRIFIENFAPCWPEFDVEEHTGVKITQGIYQQEVSNTDTCPYIFYSFSINADGLASSCFLDWGRKLIIGDARKESLPDIWKSEKMNELRILHLENKRKDKSPCNSCGQLSHCLPDNIDKYTKELLPKVKEFAKRSSIKV